MAAPNFLAGSAFLKLYWNVNTGLTMNVLALQVTGNPTFDQTLANTVGSAVKTAFTTNLASSLPPQNSLVRVGLRDYRTANRPEFRDSGAAVAGTGAVQDSLPSQVACCITLRTALSGKSYRGRVYFGGFGENVNSTSGSTNTAAATAAIAFLQAVNSSIAGSGFALAVMSRPAERETIVRTIFHNDGTTTVQTLSTVSQKAGAITPVTAYESRNTAWETQRRRNNGRGQVPTSLTSNVLVQA